MRQVAVGGVQLNAIKARGFGADRSLLRLATNQGLLQWLHYYGLEKATNVSDRNQS